MMLVLLVIVAALDPSHPTNLRWIVFNVILHMTTLHVPFAAWLLGQFVYDLMTPTDPTGIY